MSPDRGTVAPREPRSIERAERNVNWNKVGTYPGETVAIESADDFAPAEELARRIGDAADSGQKIDALQRLADASLELTLSALREALRNPDPQISALARQLLDDARLEQLLNAVALAAQDPEPAVREAALATLEDMHEFSPIGFVAALVIGDPDPGIRMTALELIAGGDRELARSALHQATFDANPEVSELANDLLNELAQADIGMQN